MAQKAAEAEELARKALFNNSEDSYVRPCCLYAYVPVDVWCVGMIVYMVPRAMYASTHLMVPDDMTSNHRAFTQLTMLV